MAKKEMSTRKVLLISIMLIALTAILTGVGTFAYFSSTQVSGPNNFFTGSIQIAVNGADPWSGNFNATLGDIKPGMKGWGNVTVANTGMNPADLWVMINNVTTSDPTTTSAEANEPLTHDIDGVIRYDLYRDASTIIDDGMGFTIGNGTHQLAGAPMVRNNWTYIGNLPAGSSWWINQSFAMDSATTNWAQTDNMTFSVIFYAQQSQGTPRPAAPIPETQGHGRP